MDEEKGAEKIIYGKLVQGTGITHACFVGILNLFRRGC